MVTDLGQGWGALASCLDTNLINFQLTWSWPPPPSRRAPFPRGAHPASRPTRRTPSRQPPPHAAEGRGTGQGIRAPDACPAPCRGGASYPVTALRRSSRGSPVPAHSLLSRAHACVLWTTRCGTRPSSTRKRPMSVDLPASTWPSTTRWRRGLAPAALSSATVAAQARATSALGS